MCVYIYIFNWSIVDLTSQLILMVKNPPANAGDIRGVGLIAGSGRSPAGGHATHSSVLAWRIPWTEEPGGPQSVGLQRVGDDWVTEHTRVVILCLISWGAPTPSYLGSYLLKFLFLSFYFIFLIFGFKRWEYQTTWPVSWEICMQVKKQ